MSLPQGLVTSVQISNAAVPQVVASVKPGHTFPKLFKLISVSFKEAALDSPTFRASVNHLDSQLLNTEKWLVALTALMVKIPRHVKQLQSYFNSFLEYLMPLFLQDGLLDQEYTEPALQIIVDGLKNMWTISLAMITVNVPLVEQAKEGIVKRIVSYRLVRERFDASQKKYDRFLLLHMATSKTKEPALIMEDLAQLFAVRREYIANSLDLVVELSTVGDLINQGLIGLCHSLWRDKVDKFGDNPVISQILADVWCQIKRIQAWCDQFHHAVDTLHADISAARKQVEESSVAAFLPSDIVSDYASLLINSKLLADTQEHAVEKHGYLYMKTWIDRASKPIWVKRWAFIQGGVFGLLVLSPSLTSVQESDKFGVLVCGTKYTPNEDRRFCFELKTIDTTVVFQSETLDELKLWLKVFENCRARILSENDPMSGLLNIASGIYPPLVTEFSSSVNTVTDRVLTNSKIVNSAGQMITSSKLSSHLEKNEKLFQKFIYHQATHVELPFSTDATRSSLIAFSLVGSTAVPTALCANIWGSLNWGLYYLHDMVTDEEYEDEVPEEEFTRQIGTGIKVPKNYPNLWLAPEIQMRALFESAVDPQECCLLSFTGLWSPNSKRELRGTNYFTQNHVFTYLHLLGFVALSKSSIRNFVDVSCTPKKNFDILKLSKVEGLLRMKLFLDDGNLIAKKLNYMLENQSRDKPDGVTTMITKLLAIETTYRAEKEKKLHKTDEHHVSSFDHAIQLPDPAEPPRTDYSDEMPLMGEKTFKMPPKALLHVLFGNHSSLVDDLYLIESMTLASRTKWSKVSGNDRGLRREFISTLLYHNGKIGHIKVVQEFENMIENEYYTCRISRSSFKIMFGSEFHFLGRIVIFGVEGGQSKLRYFSSLKFKSVGLFHPILHNICLTSNASFFRTLTKKIEEASKDLGHSGKELKAIYLYGKISITDTPVEVPDTPLTFIRYGTLGRLMLRGSVASAVRRFLAVVLFILSSIKLLLKSLSMHRVLICVIVGLTFLNSVLVKRSTEAYWNAREARGAVRDIVQFEPMMMQRAIYLRDVQDLIAGGEFASNSVCFNTFKNQSFVLNYDQSIAWRSSYEDDLTRETAVKLRKALQDIGIRRNELIVNLRLLNQMEEEVARGEWRNWLANELEKCDFIQHQPIIPELGVNSSDISSDFASGVDTLMQFCDCCSHEMQLL